MPKGLTYPTKSQAEQQAEDYRKQGLTATVKQTGALEWKVLLSEGLREPRPEEIIKEQGILTPEEEESVEIEKRVREKRIAQKVERRTAPTKQQEIRRTLREAERKLAVKKELEQTPEEIEKATLEQKKKRLELANEERKMRGRSIGRIIPVYDPDTRQVIDYELETGTGSEALEKRTRELSRTVGEMPITRSGEFTEQTLRNTSSEMSIKGGFKRSVQGGVVTSPGGISGMTRARIGSTGAIGVEKPAISKIAKPDINKVKIQTTGTVRAMPNVEKTEEEKIPKMSYGIPYLKKNID